MNGAFTLIELLAVTAIIGLLAAILFPVFAQAREAAARGQSISNVKQITLSQFLYAGDNDDTVAMNRNCQLVRGGGLIAPCVAGRVILGWIDLTSPYLRNYGVFKSAKDDVPSAPLPNGALDLFGQKATHGILWGPRPASGQPLGGDFRSSYARNNNFANNGTNTAKIAEAESPANLILIYSFAANSGAGAHPNDGSPGSSFTIVRRPIVEPAPNSCRSYDPSSTGNHRSNFFGALPAYAQEHERSQVSSERYQGRGVYGFADGHARALRPEEVRGQCTWGSRFEVERGNNGRDADFRF